MLQVCTGDCLRWGPLVHVLQVSDCEVGPTLPGAPGRCIPCAQPSVAAGSFIRAQCKWWGRRWDGSRSGSTG